MFSPKSVKKIKVAEGPVTTANITKSRLRPRKMISALKKISFKSDKENFVERVIEDSAQQPDMCFVNYFSWFSVWIFKFPFDVFRSNTYPKACPNT